MSLGIQATLLPYIAHVDILNEVFVVTRKLVILYKTKTKSFD